MVVYACHIDYATDVGGGFRGQLSLKGSAFLLFSSTAAVAAASWPPPTPLQPFLPLSRFFGHFFRPGGRGRPPAEQRPVRGCRTGASVSERVRAFRVFPGVSERFCCRCAVCSSGGSYMITGGTDRHLRLCAQPLFPDHSLPCASGLADQPFLCSGRRPFLLPLPRGPALPRPACLPSSTACP